MAITEFVPSVVLYVGSQNIPNSKMLSEFIGCPLTSVPDPFNIHPSFAQKNNALLRQFLDLYEFDYELEDKKYIKNHSKQKRKD